MAYKRKGGSGKSGTLREQFNYYKRQLKTRYIEEQALIEATGGSLEGKPSTLFEHFDYDEIFNSGITRKDSHGQTVRYTGTEAISIQIKSFKSRASKSIQVENYISNYCHSLNEIGMPLQYINQIRNAMQSTSGDKLTILIRRGILPDIYFVYSETMDYESLRDEILTALKSGVSSEEFKQIKETKKQLKNIVKQKFKILGW